MHSANNVTFCLPHPDFVYLVSIEEETTFREDEIGELRKLIGDLASDVKHLVKVVNENKDKVEMEELKEAVQAAVIGARNVTEMKKEVKVEIIEEAQEQREEENIIVVRPKIVKRIK